MYTFDYKDEPHQDLEDCNSAVPDQMTRKFHEERPNSPPTAADGPDESMDDQQERQPTLFSSVRVYAIAEKYAIPALKELARHRFCNWADENWSCDEFSAVAREIFESTPSHDRGLRDIVVRLVAKHMNALVQQNSVRQLVEDAGNLGWGVICQLHETHSKEQSRFKSRIEALEAENTGLEEQVKESRRSLKWRIDSMDMTLSKVNSLAECRNCKKGFNVDIEGTSFGGQLVRCKSCRCRH
jgi:hypothetical protein